MAGKSAPAGAITIRVGDNVSAIVKAAPMGATFFFEPGVHRGVSVAPKNGQTFLASEGAILNGSKLLTDWTKIGDLWVIGGQTQRGDRRRVGVAYIPGFERAGYPETVFLDDKPLKPVDAASKVAPGTFYFDYGADKIYVADSPAGRTLEAGQLVDAFHGAAKNVVVQNLVVEKYSSPIQHATILGGRGWTIRNCEVRLNFSEGIRVLDNSRIIGNYVHDNGDLGITGSGKNILVEGNEIARNGFWAGVDPFWGAGGFKFTNTDGLVVRNNYSHQNDAYGMWTDINNIHTLYEKNVVTHNTGIGISHEISYDAIIRDNVVMNNSGDPRGWLWGGQIQIQNSSNVDVYRNKVDMTGGNGITLIQQDRGSGRYGPYLTTNVNIYDNVILSRNATGIIGGAGELDGNAWRDNRYFMADGEGRFWWGGGFYDFKGFKNATGETGSISQIYPDTDEWLSAFPHVAGADRAYR